MEGRTLQLKLLLPPVVVRCSPAVKLGRFDPLNFFDLENRLGVLNFHLGDPVVLLSQDTVVVLSFLNRHLIDLPSLIQEGEQANEELLGVRYHIFNGPRLDVLCDKRPVFSVQLKPF